MISRNKTYITRNGWEAHIAAIIDDEHFQVLGIIKNPETQEWMAESWSIDGHFEFNAEDESEWDLIEIKGRVKRTYWVNLYNPPEGESRLYLRHDTAMENRLAGWIGCAKIKIDIEEGEQQI